MNTLLQNEFWTYWADIAKKKTITSADMAARAIILAWNPDQTTEENISNAKSRLLKSFSPITNSNKLNNGQAPWQGMYWAIYATKHQEPCLFKVAAGENEDTLASLVYIRNEVLKEADYGRGFKNA